VALWAVDFIRGEKTPETRIEELREHMNRDKLSIACVAHGNGQLLETAALRLDGPEGCEELTPWLSGVFIDSHSRRWGIGAALCAHVEDEARSREIQALYPFTLDKQAWFSCMGWTMLGPCLWRERPGNIMCKQLQGGVNRLHVAANSC
jgi:N-acetylglutamate synthase-like GNAT family acetyltransferase